MVYSYFTRQSLSLSASLILMHANLQRDRERREKGYQSYK